MKKVFVFAVLVAFLATAAFAQKADSTKAFSKKQYTVIAGKDTVKVTAGDSTTKVTFTQADSVKATGKFDYQMIKGKKTKVKEVMSHGKTFWVLDDTDLSKPQVTITMWCDQDDDDASTSFPLSGIAITLISIAVIGGLLSLWRFVLR